MNGQTADTTCGPRGLLDLINSCNFTFIIMKTCAQKKRFLHFRYQWPLTFLVAKLHHYSLVLRKEKPLCNGVPFVSERKVSKSVSNSEFYIRRRAHCITASTAPVSVTEVPLQLLLEQVRLQFVPRRLMSCSLIIEVQVVCSTAKTRTKRRSADREKFVGPSDSWTKQSAAVDNLLSKPPEHRGPPSSLGLHRVDTSTSVQPSWISASCEGTVCDIQTTIAKYR